MYINDDTSLHSACQFGHEAIAHLLLDRGADINIKNKVSTGYTHI